MIYLRPGRDQNTLRVNEEGVKDGRLQCEARNSEVYQTGEAGHLD